MSNETKEICQMFYDNLVSACERSNLTPLDLRKELSIPHPTMSSWKNNGSTPRQPMLGKIAARLDTTPELLTQEKPKKGKSTNKPDDKERLLRSFENLNATGKRTAVARLNELAQIRRYSA